MANSETKILNTWKARIGLLFLFVTPTVTGVGAFYGLKQTVIEKEASLNHRISEVELTTQKNFADKETIREMSKDIEKVRNDISEIKTMMLQRLRR